MKKFQSGLFAKFCNFSLLNSAAWIRILNVKAIAAQEPPFFHPLISKSLGVYYSTSLAEAVYIYSIVLGRMDAHTASLVETNPVKFLLLLASSNIDYRTTASCAQLNITTPQFFHRVIHTYSGGTTTCDRTPFQSNSVSPMT